ncbi:MAG: NADH-quinone oxidoreductase subunit NuoG [Pseudomonadota bacterium]
MSDDNTIKLEVDGQEVEARRGQMLIEVTDKLGAYVPRFCYHEKLSVAANCRMCLVEVERAPKPLPACATPVADGMKVSTKSRYAISAQRATMEFLLINHPLDCPICDQGGECELQDLAMGYGRDISRYTEKKRVVKDKNIGPLVSTDMTRCIHCTRCVRFGQEIQGIQELGTTGRGENMRIGTYIEKNVDHELSANIIDLCPVGALNNKPYRYSARAWEMVQEPMIGAHDCVGSNLYVHSLRGRVKRVVPRGNDAINETWISDRDRFSYEGVYSDARLKTPMRKSDDDWAELNWEDALTLLAKTLVEANGDVGFLVAPTATLEEGFLLNRIAAHLGSADIDSRLMQRDTTNQDFEPLVPTLGIAIEDIEQQDHILLVGARLREEAPILAHRVRKATLAGGTVSTIDFSESEYLFERTSAVTGDLLAELQDVLAAVRAESENGSNAGRIGAALRDADQSLIVLGVAARSHPHYSTLREIAAELARLTGATLGDVTDGPNAAGLAMMGVRPHRELGGAQRDKRGRAVAEMLNEPPKVFVLWGVDPEVDLGEVYPAAAGALRKADTVISLSPFFDDAMGDAVDIALPIGTFAETAGTYVNVEGRQQSWHGVASPVGEARPGWKLLRALGDLLEVEDIAFNDADSVRHAALAALEAAAPVIVDALPQPSDPTTTATVKPLERGLYACDQIVRRAHALQQTHAALGLKPETSAADLEQSA